ncbi:MAG: hypothetical protein ACK4TJ_00810 [Tabrizicola sp.]
MTTIIRTERRKRSIFGKLFLLLFWLFNLLMALWLFSAFQISSDQIAAATSGAQRAGATIGTGLATGIILTIWMAGAVILGLLVLLTPSKTIITETTRD